MTPPPFGASPQLRWGGKIARKPFMKPGEILTAPGELELNKGRNPITIEVANTGDRPIQVGSHYHFFETNDALAFDRKRAKGMRLDIAAGTAVRFGRGRSRSVRRQRARGGRARH